MTAPEIFNYIKNAKYATSGKDVDWCIYKEQDTKTIYLVFAESNSMLDWIHNLSFPTKAYKNQCSCIRAARGWLKAWKSCNDEVADTVIKVLNDSPDYTLTVTGWSYGGAIALLAAEDLAFRTKYTRKPNVITFGAPKPFWGKHSVRYLKKVLGSIKEYKHLNDIVGYMPPFPGYKQLGKVKLGKFNFFKLFNPVVYHQCYGDSQYYE